MMTPKVTVAMPTCERIDYMRVALDSLLQQKVDFPYEVLVLDNGCDPAVEAHVKAAGHPASVSLCYQAVAAKGLHNCRHLAAQEARGSILALVDDDIIADPQWLASVRAAFDDSLTHLVTGPVVPLYETDVPDWLELFWHRTGSGGRWCGYLSLLDLGSEPQTIDPRLVFGVNFAIRPQTVFDLGGFNPDSLPWRYRRYRGDGETAVAVAAEMQGLKAVYHPGARMQHRVPAQRLTIEYFEKRAYLQGISDSFSEYRKPVQEDGPIHQAGPGVLRKTVAFWRRLRRRVLEDGRRQAAATLRNEKLLRSIETSRQRGYRYHRRLIETDPSVRQWVQRADFWDGRLPDQTNSISQ